MSDDETRWFRVRDGAPYVGLGFASIAQHRARIEYNHVATLEQINADGGLDWFELYCGLTDRALFPAPSLTMHAMRDAVLRIVSSRKSASQISNKDTENGK